ncbi:hypothetical protein [Nocardioides marmoribigeumensis]|uniref:Uncharacterized protein n=1 Tax=Nocardioides marmoribigeumensis TaxID=433649 RepID=A0ABU2C0U6_9ACTN|nr:hypothetical protein [Nocardioides marmoribigeumensis]MDR7364297.1 hypothetical protein [Nocardioides marmoribigeumensis]
MTLTTTTTLTTMTTTPTTPTTTTTPTTPTTPRTGGDVRTRRTSAVRVTSAARCRCGQQLDCCARSHCPRCGRTLPSS